MVILAFTIVGLNSFQIDWPLQLFRNILLLSSIIPISLRVNLDIAKIFYCYLIYNDKEIKGTIPRNSTIPEDLGRIQYILTDKTGTLTQNDMTFKKVRMEIGQFDTDNLADLKNMIDDNCNKYLEPMADIPNPDLAKSEV
jgi:phospholipid-translocating ATPase